MSTSKHVFLIVARWATVVVAMGFLVFYVARARRKQNEMLSSSKSLVGVYAIETQATIDRLAGSASGDPAIAPVPAIPPAPSPTSAASKDSETTSDPFRFRILPTSSVTLGGSKSMSRPVVEISDFRSWALAPETTSHTFGLPFLRALPAEVTFGEPAIRVQAEGIANGTEPPPTPPSPPPPPTTPDMTSSVPAPEPAPSRTVP